MSAIHAIVLGVVQGLAEFLPISSTAHLRIVPAFLGWGDPGAAFSAVIQLGTTLAVILYFRRDLWHIISAWFRGLRDAEVRRTLESRLGWYIGLGTLPVAVLGLIFKDQIETQARSLRLIAVMLIVLGLVLLVADRVSRKVRDVNALSAKDGAVIGIAQAAALVPGVSRSGATISAGLFLGLTREAAARYSFLLATPAVLLSGLFELRKVGGAGLSVGPTVLSAIVAFFVGYASIAFLLRYLARHSTLVFAVYRVALGALVLVLVSNKSIH